MSYLLIYLALYFGTAALAYPIGYIWTALEESDVINARGPQLPLSSVAGFFMLLFLPHTIAFMLGALRRISRRGGCCG